MIEPLHTVITDATVYGPDRPINLALKAKLNDGQLVSYSKVHGGLRDLACGDQEVLLVEFVAGDVLGDDSGVGGGHEEHHEGCCELQQDGDGEHGVVGVQEKDYFKQDAERVD